MSEDTRRQLDELKAAYKAGKLPGWTGNDLYREIVKPQLNLTVTTESFRRWMAE